MKVLHIVGCPLRSGAGRAVRALHDSLMTHGIDSRLLGRVESGLPPELNATPVSVRDRLPVSLANRFYLWRLRRRFGAGLENFHPVSHGLSLHVFHDYRAADIVHIQWANATTLSRSFWRNLKHEQRPIVWTLRDMWPFTGGCHYSGSCPRYISGCGSCPQLGSDPSERITDRDLEFKASQLGDNVTFVAISQTIADQARVSLVLKDRDIRVIPNSVVLNGFDGLASNTARAALGLPPDRFIVAAGALNLADPRKGPRVLAALLERYRRDSSVYWAIFGRGLEELLDHTPENCTSFGSVDDDHKLNQIYAAADLFVMPSLQESFGKVTVEAMASGTAVVAFSDTPAVEMIRDGETGWIVPHGDQAAFVEAVGNARDVGSEVLKAMGECARADVLDRFSMETVVREHMRLYHTLIQRPPMFGQALRA